MRIAVWQEKAFIIDGIGKECDGIINVEVENAYGDEKMRINGNVFHMKNGKMHIPMGAFGEFSNDIRIYHEGSWHIIDGIVKNDSHLLLDEAYVANVLFNLLRENDRLKKSNQELKGKVEALEKRCSGEEFL